MASGATRARSVADIETQIATTTSTPPAALLQNGGKLEVTSMVDHESSRTTGIYDHRSDRVSSTKSNASASDRILPPRTPTANLRALPRLPKKAERGCRRISGQQRC